MVQLSRIRAPYSIMLGYLEAAGRKFYIRKTVLALPKLGLYSFAKMAPEINIDSPPNLSDEAGTVDSSPPVNKKALLRKLDVKLLPAVRILYLLSLDRSNGRDGSYLHNNQRRLT